MSLAQQEKDIRTEIERAKAAWTAYTLKIEYDNRDSVDLAALTDPYLMVDIVWGDAQQMDIGQRPLVSDYGSIIVAAGCKVGAGKAPLLALLDFFRPYLQLRNPLGTVKTHVAHVDPRPVEKDGYYYQTMTVPFWSQAQAPVVP
jgi:hypothetical protein